MRSSYTLQYRRQDGTLIDREQVTPMVADMLLIAWREEQTWAINGRLYELIQVEGSSVLGYGQGVMEVTVTEADHA